MNINFPPPSNGTYNNADSSRQLANYCEHEDMQRMEQGIYTEGLFNLTDDNVYKSQVIKSIDGNIGQLLKNDAKFYAIHISPSEKELQAMGNTEREQAEAMKRYIREVFIPEYAKYFNKGLSAEDIKLYGKIHFNRDRSDNCQNMHCHLIISRKDQSNKIKISLLTNHRNTKKGVITGGFDRITLFKNAEKGFDKLFGYNRQLSETLEYYTTMKNGSVTDKLRMQERELKEPKQDFVYKKKEIVDVQTDENVKAFSDISIQRQISMSVNKPIHQQINESSLSSLFSILPSATDVNPTDEQQPLNPKKKKKRRPRLS